METKNMLETLKTEIQDKDIKISQYEEQLTSIKREISDFFNNLKYILNNLEEFNGVCEEVCNCTKCNLDIGEEANNILYNISIIITRFQSYKIESQNLLQQIGDLKHIGNDKQGIYSNQNLKYMICEKFSCSSEMDLNNTIGNNAVVFNVRQDINNLNKIEFDDISNVAGNINLLSEANNLDSCEHQKECQNYTIKLNKKNDMDNIEKEIIEYFTHFLIKLRSLTQKLQIYVEIERPVMIKQTYYFYEILKDTQSAINVSQDVILKKKLISQLYNQHKEEHKKRNSYIKQLPNDLLEVQNKINEFIENILYQLLNEILDTEKKYLYDEKINKAIETHLKSCINRISTALQGVGDQHLQIVETIEEQKEKLERKDLEITQLKEVAQQQKGEGDCLSRKNFELKEQLSKATMELNNKNDFILKLEEQLEILKSELLIYNKNYNTLTNENKNLENIKNRLSKECQENKKQLITKTQKIKNLSQQVHEIHEIKNLKTILENKIKEMEKKLNDLQFENNELKENITQSNIIISTKDENITILKSKIAATNNVLSQKIAEYKNTMEEKHYEIIKLENENKLLNEKVKDIEHKLTEMNLTIVSLTEQNDKINIIYTMQEDLTKLDKNEKKLKIELNNLRTQFINDQNNNKKLDNSLDIYLRENEILKKNVEYWKNENSELLNKLHNEIMEENLKSKLYTLSNQIYERLLSLQKQTNLEKDPSYNKLIKKLQDQCITHQDQVMKLTADNTNEDLKLESGDQKREIKENEIEKVDIQLLNNANIKEMCEDNYIKFKQINFSQNNLIINNNNQNNNNNLMTRHKIKFFKNEHNENQNEVMNTEIKHPKEIIKHLIQENADLRAILQSQMEEYQNKLILMKKNYDSSLNAVSERHKANVEILQKQFEDDMKSEKMFDPENWLLSLNMEELIELHRQIIVIINSNTNIIHMENENQCLYANNAQEQFYTKLNKTEKKFRISLTNLYETESIHKNIISVLKEKDSHLQNKCQFIDLNDSSLEHNFRYFNSEKKSPELENKCEKEKQTKEDSIFDRQRWSFINQCSAYHKLSNVYEYSRTLPTDY
ncbi:putative leucine-rich repeat-containing protein DDB_G0290503 [Frieseomelitta varia]|nr:putative leucine-rich repeat-containing protein DDB_G0290503 [Frieseomelitta varia]